ncbi:MAG: hypothetical protein LW595_06040 [Rickettsiales bacterium]|nr:hypothetical protein [Rickettsiales bacterium]
MYNLSSYFSQFWQDYGDFIIYPLLSSGISLMMIEFWFKTRMKAIDNKYSEKIEILKSGLSKEITHQAAVYSSFSEAQKAAMERKLLAIDKLWQTLIEFRENLPPTLYIMDILLEEEYQNILLNNPARIINENFIKNFKNIDDVRPYIGELMWYLFSSYRTIFLRISFLIKSAQGGDYDKIHWKKDSALISVIYSLLTKEEVQDFNNLKTSNIEFLKKKLESKIITEMHKVISGKDLVNDSTDQIFLIDKRLNELDMTYKTINKKP